MYYILKSSHIICIFLINCHLLCVCAKWLLLCLSVTPWTVPLQVPLFMGFSRQEYWSGLPCPPPGDLPDPGTEPASLRSSAAADRFFTIGATWEAHLCE